MSKNSWPRPLHDAAGPVRSDKIDGAAEGMGVWGPETRALIDDGYVPPDIMTGLTLFLLGSQPRDRNQKVLGAGGGVAGGVWVRERNTIHRPLGRDDVFTVTGESEGRHVHKGRRYGTTRCQTHNAAGELTATNLTTGLLAYRVEEDLEDSLEGEDPDTITSPEPDWTHAGSNRCGAKLRELSVGQALGGYELPVTLAMMEARDTKKPDNPIHSDPEIAKKAGLEKPIAGGSHVLAFALEPIMAFAGRDVLLYGSSFDIRWKAPVYADLVIRPHARVAAITDDRITFEVDAILASDAVAMVGTVTVPLP